MGVKGWIRGQGSGVGVRSRGRGQESGGEPSPFVSRSRLPGGTFVAVAEFARIQLRWQKAEFWRIQLRRRHGKVPPGRRDQLLTELGSVLPPLLPRHYAQSPWLWGRAVFDFRWELLTLTLCPRCLHGAYFSPQSHREHREDNLWRACRSPAIATWDGPRKAVPLFIGATAAGWSGPPYPVIYFL